MAEGKSLYSHKDANIRKTWLLMTAFLVFIIAIGWVFSGVYDTPVFVIAAVVISLIMNFVSFWYSDKIVLRLSRAQPATRENYPELYRIMENLCITAGLPMPRLYIIDESQPNAFATGRSPKNAVVGVTRGLLERLDRSELEGVLAHELAHIGNRDMLLSTVVVVLAGSIALISDIFLRSLFWGGGRRSRGGPLMIVLAIVVAILAPLAAMMIRFAVSRKREFLADASGALLTRYPDGLARALEKISGDPTPMRRAASNATAHLWLGDPFKGKARRSWFHKIFMTHPPAEERIKALRSIDV